MKISIPVAHELVVATMKRLGYDSEGATITADHLIDCELRGFGVGGLARALTLTERISASEPFRPITIVTETDTVLALDGGDQVGYIVGKQLTEVLIKKALDKGVSVGGANNTWCTGMFSYYLEMITSAGLAGFVTSSGGPTVAPHGGSQAIFGTNPVALGFPTSGDPIIWDIGTSEAMLADLSLAKRHETPLRQGIAYDSEGNATTDAVSALEGGAIRSWGGHRGSGLALSAQLLGIMVGSAPAPPWLTDMGFFVTVFDPGVFSSDFPARATAYAEFVRASRPLDPEHPVRMPFERSIATRDEIISQGEFEVSDHVVSQLRSFVASN